MQVCWLVQSGCILKVRMVDWCKDRRTSAR